MAAGKCRTKAMKIAAVADVLHLSSISLLGGADR
ncbi:hypothetical protein CCACVL1_11266 [Corchorus capsularis]|uniref:Uncharacterized protein n=1 Tax=Corchorus capsularis TaxID=210143 RepID=A0A1R3IMB5_COCAP|nr:hypothetical protein CCACVL1_11266 [Corchorus capsularis]